MRRSTWRLLALGLAVVAVGIAWQAWEEWRVRRRLDEALASLAPFVDGPVATWLERLPPSPSPNASMRELERLARATPIDFGTERVRQAAWREAHGTEWMDTLRQHVETALAEERIGGGSPIPAPSAADGYSSLAEPIREHLLTQPLPEWPVARDPATRVLHLDALNRLADLIVADARVRQDAGDDDGAARSLDAAWRLVETLRRRDDIISQLFAWRVATLCAVAVRRLERPRPEWRARLDIEPFRQALLHATLVGGFAWHAAARARDVPPSWLDRPDAGRLHAMLSRRPYSRAERLAVADGLQATLPFLTALEDPARCGPTTIPPEWTPGAGLEVAEQAAASPTFLVRLDRLRVRFELTRKVLDLRELRAADPSGRWPVTLGEEASECPGVRFVTTAPQPTLVVLEAVAGDDTWLADEQAQWTPPLRVELAQPPAATGAP